MTSVFAGNFLFYVHQTNHIWLLKPYLLQRLQKEGLTPQMVSILRQHYHPTCIRHVTGCTTCDQGLDKALKFGTHFGYRTCCIVDFVKKNCWLYGKDRPYEKYFFVNPKYNDPHRYGEVVKAHIHKACEGFHPCIPCTQEIAANADRMGQMYLCKYCPNIHYKATEESWKKAVSHYKKPQLS